MRTIVQVTSICLFVTGAVSAQAPRLERIENAGGQRGKSFEIVCHGERMDKVNDALFYDRHLTTENVQSNDSTSTVLTVTASKDCPPGEYPIRLLSPDGASEMRTIHISPYPRQHETEPNNSLSQAMEIRPGTTIHGLVDEGDVDCFQIELKQGQRLAAEVVGIRNTNYVFDSRLAILGSNGDELAVSDDCPLLLQDPMVSFVAPEDGTYFVQLREAAFGGDLDSVYQLHVGEHPRPTVCYPPGGMAGAEQTLTLIGDAAGPTVVTRELPESAGTTEFHPQDDRGVAPTPVRLRVAGFPNSLEVEPNDSRETASLSVVSLPVALNGILQQNGDIDWFRFRAEAGRSFDVSAWGHRIGSPVDTVVTLCDASGRTIVKNDDGANHDSMFRFTVPETGEYLISVQDHLGRGGSEFVYRIEFEPVRPSLTLSIPILSENRQQQRQSIQLARGSRMAVVISARRQNFMSDVEISPDALPPGVTAESSVISSGSHLGYLLFSADDDAPLSAGLIGIHGTGTAVSESVHGSLKQKTGLAFGPPRRTAYHSVEADQIPITIIEHAPFVLDVEQPAVPVPRDGQLDLKVTAVRNGYDGDIELTLPVLPPWIEVPEDGVSIPSGSDSTTFTLTATDAAKARSWTVLMVGAAQIDGEQVFAASDEFEFTVADPYLDLTIDSAIASQEQKTSLVCRCNWFDTVREGTAVARLRGLPVDVSVEDVQVAVGAPEFTFDVAAGADAPASLHNTLFVEIEVPESGATVRHFLGRGGVLEILSEGDKPRDARSRLSILRAQAAKPSSDSKFSPVSTSAQE